MTGACRWGGRGLLATWTDSIGLGTDVYLVTIGLVTENRESGESATLTVGSK